MNVLIIEDERAALENIIRDLDLIQEGVHVVGTCGSIYESMKWLEQNQHPEVIFMDIELSDGPSFQILKEGNISCPVIFITAYDKYMKEAFEYNSIDYLMKPVTTVKLANAIRKYKSLQNHFVNNFSSFHDYLISNGKKKSRIVVKRGMEFQTIKIEDIGYFFTENKLVFLVDKENRKYLAETSNLAELEEELDIKMFYRANRKFIINANFIKRFKTFEKSKISLELILPMNEEIVVSQENASAFKRWISEI